MCRGAVFSTSPFVKFFRAGFCKAKGKTVSLIAGLALEGHQDGVDHRAGAAGGGLCEEGVVGADQQRSRAPVKSKRARAPCNSWINNGHLMAVHSRFWSTSATRYCSKFQKEVPTELVLGLFGLHLPYDLARPQRSQPRQFVKSTKTQNPKNSIHKMGLKTNSGKPQPRTRIHILSLKQSL